MEEISYSTFILFIRSYEIPYMYKVSTDKQDDYILVSIFEIVEFFNTKYPYQMISVSEHLNLNQHFVFIIEKARIERVYPKTEVSVIKNSFDDLRENIKKQLFKRGSDEI